MTDKPRGMTLAQEVADARNIAEALHRHVNDPEIEAYKKNHTQLADFVLKKSNHSITVLAGAQGKERFLRAKEMQGFLRDPENLQAFVDIFREQLEQPGNADQRHRIDLANEMSNSLNFLYQAIEDLRQKHLAQGGSQAKMEAIHAEHDELKTAVLKTHDLISNLVPEAGLTGAHAIKPRAQIQPPANKVNTLEELEKKWRFNPNATRTTKQSGDPDALRPAA